MVAFHLWRVIYKFLRANASDAARCHLLWRLVNGFYRGSAQPSRQVCEVFNAIVRRFAPFGQERYVAAGGRFRFRTMDRSTVPLGL